jgi:hypothetical protein
MYMIKHHQNKRKSLAKQVTYISASTAVQTSGTSICRDVTDDPHPSCARHTQPTNVASVYLPCRPLLTKVLALKSYT